MSDDDLELDLDPAELPPSEQETVSADSPETERRRKTRIRREFEEAVGFWTDALKTQIGRREIWKLLQSAHTFEDRFACGPNGFPQVEATWFQAGEKAFGQRLWLSLQRYDLAGVLQMHSEHDDRLGKPTVPRTKVNG
jgi:hypothetical protein